MMSVHDELVELLNRVVVAFSQSDIRHKAMTRGYRWAYSLITGACRPHAPLIVGFNWGAQAGEQYDPQSTIKETRWNKSDLGSFARILPYMARYLPDLPMERISQTNYCFFRSEKEEQISARDLELCSSIFEQLLRVMKPTLVLGFSSRLRDHLLSSHQVTQPQITTVEQMKGKGIVAYTAVSGVLAGGATVAFLPHPNCPIRKETREKLWGFCADQMQAHR